MVNYLRAYFYLKSLMKSAYWPRDKLEVYQDKKLKEIVSYAYKNVPFYHKKFKQLGIKPSDFRGKADLNKLPVITKDEIRSNLCDMISKEFDAGKLRSVSTSGSTGKPLTVYISGAENEFRKAKHLRANISCGQKFHHRWVTITAPHHFGEATKFQKLLGFYVPIPISVFTDVSLQIEVLKKIRPDILDGYSSTLLLLGKEIAKRDSKPFKPLFIIGGAEFIDDSSRHFIEEVFDAPLYDQYACVELERIAWQCPEKIGYHIDSDTTIVQFVDENGEEVCPGEQGEVVCTSLFNYAMPLIRYAVGDVGIPSDDECPCGRSLPLMKVMEGRKDSLLFLADGRVLSPRTFTIAMSMFKFYKFVDQFRIVQKSKDLFEIYVKMKDSSLDNDVFERGLVDHLRRTINLPVDLADIEVNFVEDFPLDKSGKFTIVVSELSKNARVV